jgi:hypothetical protein
MTSRIESSARVNSPAMLRRGVYSPETQFSRRAVVDSTSSLP